jgi:hypothetical protein
LPLPRLLCSKPPICALALRYTLVMPTTISLSEKLQHQLEEAAERTGKPQDELVTEALTEYFSRARGKFSSFGAGNDPTLDARQTRELLKQAWGKR